MPVSQASRAVIGGGFRRIVERWIPTTVQAQRCDTPNRSRNAAMALRLRFTAMTANRMAIKLLPARTTASCTSHCIRRSNPG